MLRGTWLALLLAAPPLGAQAEVSAGVGAGSIRYSGGATAGTVTLSPTLSFSGPRGTIGLTGAVGPLERGDWATQLRGDAWIQWPTTWAVRPAVAVAVEGSAQSGGPATGAAHLLGEAMWTADGWGLALGAGPSIGAIASTPAVSALHTRARVWGRIDEVVATAVVEPQRLDGAWFTDVALGATTPGGRLTVSAWLAARLSGSYGSRAAGSLALTLGLTDRVAIETAGGSYLPDLYQGFPAATFVAVGARVYLTPRPPAVRIRSPGRHPALAVRQGDSVRVRFRVPGAAHVAVAGDWTEWRPVALATTRRDVWEAWFRLAAGVYQFVLIIDGTRWTIPDAVARVRDGMGGEAGLLTVP